MRPLIGISATPSEHLSATLDITRPIDALDRSYVDSVLHAGGIPVLLPVMAPGMAEDLLPRLDGLVLSGGGDVGPSLYGAEQAPETDGVDHARDAFEVVLARLAVESDLPTLCICRGHQVLNVALGGTLVQHLEDAADRQHVDAATYHTGTHSVAVEPGTLLHQLVGDEVKVNSLHHQAVDRPGEGVRVVARDDDGVVEAVEVEGRDRILGVQWHPEMLLGEPDNDALFRWLVDLAGGA